MALQTSSVLKVLEIEGWTLALRTKSTTQRYKKERVDGGVTNLYDSVLKIYKRYNTKIQTLQGGRWHYKLVVSLKFTKYTIKNTKMLG